VVLRVTAATGRKLPDGVEIGVERLGHLSPGGANVERWVLSVLSGDSARVSPKIAAAPFLRRCCFNAQHYVAAVLVGACPNAS
jgi:hypothetical protein